MVGSGPFTIARDEANGLPVSVASPDTTWSRTFSGYGELSGTSVSARGGAAFSWSVTRDAAGRIATKQETTQGGSTLHSYTYDDTGRLTSVTSDGAPAESYSYDAQGNRTAETVTARGSVRTLTYDAEDRILTAGADTYAFSEDGFLTTKHTPEGATTYDYGPTGELRGARLPSGVRIAYTYDAMGRRIYGAGGSYRGLGVGGFVGRRPSGEPYSGQSGQVGYGWGVVSWEVHAVQQKSWVFPYVRSDDVFALGRTTTAPPPSCSDPCGGLRSRER